MTRIKVCGLTRAEDVRRAAELGAWALGFVLTNSPRRVSAARAATLVAEARAASSAAARGGAPPLASGAVPAACPAPLTVTVVATESPAWIAEAFAASDVDAVQLSAGAEGPPVSAVRAELERLQAARRRPFVIAAADAPDAHLADLVLLDARAPGVYGGTGRTLDWAAVAAGASPPRDRLMLAGGLTPANVAAAIAALRPAVVDVSSGVESTPGVKHPSLLREFFAAVEHADREHGVTEDSAPVTTRRGTRE